MTRLSLLITATILAIFCSTGLAAEINQDNFPDSGMTKVIYGDKHVFTVVVPEHWATDPETQKRAGIPFLTRPLDAWETVYMYALGFDNDPNNPEDLQTFVKNDIKNYKANNSGIQVKALNLKFESIKKDKSLSGKYCVYEFSDFQDVFKEIVVYIEFPEGVGTIVFSTKSKEVYERYFNDFVWFTNSFQFMANHMIVVDLNKK